MRRALTLATIVCASLLLPGVAPGARPRVAVIVVPRIDLADYAKRGAVGLLVPGSGSWVSGEGALAALEQGRARRAELGGVPHGRTLIHVGGPPAPITVRV